MMSIVIEKLNPQQVKIPKRHRLSSLESIPRRHEVIVYSTVTQGKNYAL